MAVWVTASPWPHLDWILVVSAGWLLLGAAGAVALRRLAFVARVLFPLGGVLGLVLFVVAAMASGRTLEVAEPPIGLPSLPFHLRLDNMAACFLMIIGAASAGISAFARPAAMYGSTVPNRACAMPRPRPNRGWWWRWATAAAKAASAAKATPAAAAWPT